MTSATEDSQIPGFSFFYVHALHIFLARSKQSFKYDHLRKEATDLQPWTTDCEGAEGLRSAIETEIVGYVKNHYKHGVTAVFSKEVANH